METSKLRMLPTTYVGGPWLAGPSVFAILLQVGQRHPHAAGCSRAAGRKSFKHSFGSRRVSLFNPFKHSLHTVCVFDLGW